jgi:hypothetical protein
MLRTAGWVEAEGLALGLVDGVMLVVVGVVPVPGGGDKVVVEVEVKVDPWVLVEGGRSSPTRPK